MLYTHTPLLRLSISDNQSLVGYPVAQVANHDHHIKKLKCENARKRLLENALKSKIQDHIRLKKLQYETKNQRLSVTQISKYYTKWVSENDYLLFSKDGIQFAVLASKRGNPIYIKNLAKKFKILDSKNLSSGRSLYDDSLQETTTDILFITLTVDPKLISRDDAWKIFGKKLNLFRSNLIKKYGAIEFIRTFESQKNGNPHLHMLVKFLDHKFRIFKYTRKSDGKKEWLVRNRQPILNFWKLGAQSKVLGCSSVKEALGYVGKYILKGAAADQKENTSLAMNWFYGKRAFSVSKNFFPSLIKGMCNSNQKNHIPDPDLTFLGVFPSSFVRRFVFNRIQFDRGKWKNFLSNSILDAITDREISKLEQDFQKSIPKRIVLKEFFEYSRVHQEKICVDTIEFDNFKDYGDDIELRSTNDLKVDYSVEEKIIEEMQLQEYFSRRKN